MLASIILSSLLIFSCQSNAENQRDYNFNHYFNDFLREILNTKVRQLILFGDSSVPLPKMDPFLIPFISYNWGDSSMNQIFGNFSNTSISGLSEFNITEIDANLTIRQINFTLRFPNLVARGRYSLRGKVFRFFAVRGNGSCAVDVIDVVINAVANFTTKSVIQINNIELDVDFRNVRVEFENLFGNKKLSSLSNTLLTKYGRFLFMKFKPIIIKNMQELLVNEINNKLYTFKNVDFIDN